MTSDRVEAENQVFDRAVARIDQQGIRGLNFAASGHLVSFKNRTELKAFIKEHGGTFLSSISPKVDYLIVNNPDAETENLRLATELGIEVISEAEFNAKADRL